MFVDEKQINLIGVAAVVALVAILYWYWLTSLELFIFSLTYILTGLAFALGFALADREEGHGAAQEEKCKKQFCVSPN
jgi:hypothetical protein